MSEKVTHLPESKKDWYQAMDQSMGLNSIKKVKTLCGKNVSVFSIDNDCATCEECQDEWVYTLDIP